MELRTRILSNPESFARGYEKPVQTLPYGKLTTPLCDLNFLIYSRIYDFCTNRFYTIHVGMEQRSFGAPIQKVECFTEQGVSSCTLEEVRSLCVSNNGWEYTVEKDLKIAAFFPPGVDLDLVLLVNVLRVLALQQYSYINQEEIEAVEYPASFSRNFHWVWFRMKPFPSILPCIRSWVQLNPEMTFHLWTDCPASEAVEYFGEELMGYVTLHSVSEIVGVAEQMGLPQYATILQDKHPNAMLLKTDLSRLFILQTYGGWYSDINDTMCLVPLKYLVDEDPDRLRFGSDYTTYGANNYFMYWKAGHPVVSQCMKDHIFPHVDFLYGLIYANSTACIAKQILRECMEILEATRQDHIFEAIGGQFPRWMQLMNDELLKWGKYHELVKLDVGLLLSLIAALWKMVDPESASLKQWWVQLKELRQWNARTQQPVWKMHPHRVPFSKEDIRRVLEMDGIEWDIQYRKTYIQLHLNQLIPLCNMGLAIQTMKVPYVAYPFCAFPEGISFVTPVAHFGDGTSAGRLMDEVENKGMI